MSYSQIFIPAIRINMWVEKLIHRLYYCGLFSMLTIVALPLDRKAIVTSVWEFDIYAQFAASGLDITFKRRQL